MCEIDLTLLVPTFLASHRSNLRQSTLYTDSLRTDLFLVCNIFCLGHREAVASDVRCSGHNPRRKTPRNDDIGLVTQ